MLLYQMIAYTLYSNINSCSLLLLKIRSKNNFTWTIKSCLKLSSKQQIFSHVIPPKDYNGSPCAYKVTTDFKIYIEFMRLEMQWRRNGLDPPIRLICTLVLVSAAIITIFLLSIFPALLHSLLLSLFLLLLQSLCYYYHSNPNRVSTKGFIAVMVSVNPRTITPEDLVDH